jgi:biopolymer transport protein ExbD
MLVSEAISCARRRPATSAKRRSKLGRAVALGALLSACGTPQPTELGAPLVLPTPPTAELPTAPSPPGRAVRRPSVAAPAGAFDGDWLRIRALGAGEVYVGESLARDDRELAALLGALGPTKRTRAVVLEVDGGLRYARVIELMELIRDAGYDEVTLSTSLAPLAPPSSP